MTICLIHLNVNFSFNSFTEILAIALQPDAATKLREFGRSLVKRGN